MPLNLLNILFQHTVFSVVVGRTVVVLEWGLLVLGLGCCGVLRGLIGWAGRGRVALLGRRPVPSTVAVGLLLLPVASGDSVGLRRLLLAVA